MQKMQQYNFVVSENMYFAGIAAHVTCWYRQGLSSNSGSSVGISCRSGAYFNISSILIKQYFEICLHKLI